MSMNCDVCNTKVTSLRKQISCCNEYCEIGAHPDCIKNSGVDAVKWECKKCSKVSVKDLLHELRKLTGKLDNMEKQMGNSIEVLNGLLDENNQLIKGQDERLNQCFSTIEALNIECSKVKEENEVLKKLLNSQEQYTRLNAVEIEGIPEVREENVVSTVINIARSLNVKLSEDHIDSCYRVNKFKNTDKERKGPKSIFVRFLSRAKKDQVMTAKTTRRTLNVNFFYPEVTGVSGNEPVYINHSLTGSNKVLFAKCREFKKRNEIKFLWIKSGKIYMRKVENSRVYIIENESNLNDVH